MKKLTFTISGIILLITLYFVLRHKAIISADIAADSFFANFPYTENILLTQHLKNVKTDHSNALAIIENNKEAITNFSYENIKAALNLFLNEATVEVSWHLNIIFSKFDDEWFITKLDQFEKK